MVTGSAGSGASVTNGEQLRYLLDSVVLIDHLNGMEAATEFLITHAAASAISVITRAEVLAGFALRDLPLGRRLLDPFRTLAPVVTTADLAAGLRRREGWKLPDAFQAALAIEHALTFVTRNTRDFGRSLSAPAVLIPYPG